MFLVGWFRSLLLVIVFLASGAALWSAPRITEISAAGQTSIADEDGDFPDWVEIYNPDAVPVNLAGWSLSDSTNDIGRWRFSAGTVVAPGGYLIVFCSEKNRALHTDFRLNAGGESVVLADSANAVVAQLTFPQQVPNLSFDGADFLANPSPGAPNDTSVVAIVRAPTFSQAHGFQTNPFNLQLNSATQGAAIHYTMDGTEPTGESPRYTAPIAIGKTSVVRAVGIADGKRPSPVVTATYLFVGDIVKQSPSGQTPAGWPKTWGANHVDYGMDPRIAKSAKYASKLRSALVDIPSISIVAPLPDLFDAETGIYANASNKGRDWERAVSIELLRPDGDPGFQVNAGLRIRGGASRTSENPKHSFRVLFKEEYGAEALEYPLFGENGAKRTEKFDLRCEQLVAWHYFVSERADFIRDIYGRDTQLALGQPATRGNFYHLFINGQYWGLYQTEERVGAEMAAEYFGGKESDYDTIKINYDNDVSGGGTDFIDGSFGAWRRAVASGVKGFESDENYFRIQGLNVDGSRNENYERLIDVDNLIDYMLAGIYIAADDSPPAFGTQNNWSSVRSRKGKFGFRFFAHDWEISMYGFTGDENRVGPHPTENPFLSSGGFPNLQTNTSASSELPSQDGSLDPTSANPWHFWEAMRMNPEFRLRVADHVHRFFFNDGAVTQNRALERWRARMEEIDLAVIGESARWGDARQEGISGPLLHKAQEKQTAPQLRLLPDGEDEDDLARITRATVQQKVLARTAKSRPKPFTRDHWLRACNEHVLEGFLAERSAKVLAHLKDGGLYPALAAPTMEPFGGPLAANSSMLMVGPTVEIPVISAHPFLTLPSFYFNPAPVYYTTDGSDPRAVGGAVASDANLYTAPLRFAKRTTVKARTFHLGSWSALVEATFEPSENLGALRITEIHYNPPAAIGDSGEFLEFQNTGTTPISLSQLRFTAGIEFTFPESTTLQPGAYFVLARDAAAFQTRYGRAADGIFTGKLGDDGETLTLATASGVKVFSLTYDDSGEWPIAPDGFGFSAVYDGNGDPDEGSNWRGSRFVGGSPGASDPLPADIPQVTINEVKPGTGRFIELHNGSSNEASLTGWKLLHDGQVFDLSSLPPISPNGFTHLDETALGAFTLPPEGGQLVLIAAAPGQSGVESTGAVHAFSYGPAVADASYSSYVTVENREFFPRLETSTPGSSNAAPLRSSVRIEEIHYAPLPSILFVGAPHLALQFPQPIAIGVSEFVELANSGETDAPIGGARIAGFGYTFPPDAVVPTHGRTLVVESDPVAFRALHQIPNDVPIFGPATGSLQDNGERVALEMPVQIGDEEGTVVIDEVRYNDRHPWPVLAARRGHSLQRLAFPGYGPEPGSWGSGEPTPGISNNVNAAPTVTIAPGAEPHTFTVSASDPDGTIQKIELIVDGESVAEAETATETFTWVMNGGVHDVWARATDDLGAVNESTSITIDRSGIPAGFGRGIHAEYFDNPELSGASIVSETAAKIGGDWFHQDPAQGVSRNSFSVRYDGQLVPRATGEHLFAFSVTGGLRFYVGNELLIDAWADPQSWDAQYQEARISLIGGQAYPIRVEYFDNDGLASLSLTWREPESFYDGEIPVALLYRPDEDPSGFGIAPATGVQRLFVGQRVNLQLQAFHAEAPVTWTIQSGQLPAGLTLAADGTLTGTPSAAGTFAFTVAAEEDGMNGRSATRTISCRVVRKGISPPTLTITKPGNRVTIAGSVLVEGTVSGPTEVASITYSLNGKTVHAFPGSATFSLQLDPVAGLVGGMNVLTMQAIDVEGRKSVFVEKYFNREYPGTLSVTVTGAGTVTRGFLGQSERTIGKSYTIRAIPAPGYLFSHWDGAVGGSESELHFTMSDDMFITAVFVPNPFLGAKGVYACFFGEEETSHRFRGRGRFSLGNKGELTGVVEFAAGTYRINTRLDPNDPTYLYANDPKTGRGLSLQLSYAQESRELLAEISVPSQVDMVTISASATAQPWKTKTPSPYRGRWNLVLAGAPDGNVHGKGFLSVRSLTNGNATIVGRFGDGRLISTNGWVHPDGRLAYYRTLSYSAESATGESISGLVQLTEAPGENASGTLRWSQSADASIIFAGSSPASEADLFSHEVAINGRRYIAPKPGSLPVPFGPAEFIVYGPVLSATLTTEARLFGTGEVRFQAPNPHRSKMTVNFATGIASGSMSVLDGVSPEQRKIRLMGIIDQATEAIQGCAVDATGVNGWMELHRRP